MVCNAQDKEEIWTQMKGDSTVEEVRDFFLNRGHRKWVSRIQESL